MKICFFLFKSVVNILCINNTNNHTKSLTYICSEKLGKFEPIINHQGLFQFYKIYITSK